MACDYDNEYKCGDSLYDLTKKILGRLKELVGFGPGSGGGPSGDVTLTVSDVEIGAVEIKDSSTDNRATVRNTDPAASDYGLVVRNIPSGTQAVSGPFLTDAELRASAVPISAASLPLPAGAATEATLSTMLTLAGFQARINTLGQKTMAASTPVVIASDQSAIAVTGPLTDAQLRAVAVPISAASLPLPAGAATQATLLNVENYVSGSSVASAPTSATVGVSSAEVVANNSSRNALYLTNTSDNVISIAFDTAAVLNSGITLFPGDSFVMQRPGLWLDVAVQAIASAAGSNLAIQEFTT
jgi:hypothetical protein